MSNFFEYNIYKENIEIISYKKLYMTSCYSSKFLKILPLFLAWFFEPTLSECPQHTHCSVGSNFVGDGTVLLHMLFYIHV